MPDTWLHILNTQVPYYRLLSVEEQQVLKGHVNVFIDEKHFEGCGGFRITDEVRLVIAAQACLLVLNFEDHYFPRLKSILVYPELFEAPIERPDEAGVIEEGFGLHAGESWNIGAVVLAWDEVVASRGVGDGENVVLHEFAHQMDTGDGASDGWPELLDKRLDAQWYEVMAREYAALRRRVEEGRRTFIDDYGAESPAEFFAVITEHFFEQPHEMREHHPEVYSLLAQFYRQDPALRFPRGR